MADRASETVHRIRLRLHEILEAGHAEDRTSFAVDAALIALIIANVIAFSLETVDAVAARHGPALEAFNAVSVAIFTVEYVLRLWVCVELPPLRHMTPWRARLRFALRPMLLIDLAAIAPFYLSMLFALDLRVLRLFRLLRFLKLARYSPALQTLGRVLARERRALVGAGVVMVAMLLFASTGIYFLERELQPDVFGSVPQAAWWALATLTTVGYGDVTPVSAAGKVFGGLIMIFGLAMFALPIGILATGFAQESGRREFVVTWSMVARVPLFAAFNAASIAAVVGHLRAQVFPAGAAVVRADEPIASMYFVAAGEVDVDFGHRRETLHAGDFFGESALLGGDVQRIVSATALTRCDLLLLDRHDFDHLLQRNAELREQIHRVARRRWEA